jgi:hypothetical protein
METYSIGIYGLSLLLDPHGVVKDAIVNSEDLIINHDPHSVLPNHIIGKNIKDFLDKNIYEKLFRNISSNFENGLTRSLVTSQVILDDSIITVIAEVFKLSSQSSTCAEYLVSLSTLESDTSKPVDSFAARSMALGFVDAAKEIVTANSTYTGIERALAHIGRALRADRAYLATVNEIANGAKKESFASHRCEWTSGVYPPQISNKSLYNVPLHMLGRAAKNMVQGRTFRSTVASLGEGAIKEVLLAQSIKSIVLCPVIIDNRFWGYIGLDDCCKERRWTGVEIASLNSFTSLVKYLVKRDEKNLSSTAPLVSDLLELEYHRLTSPPSL